MNKYFVFILLYINLGCVSTIVKENGKSNFSKDFRKYLHDNFKKHPACNCYLGDMQVIDSLNKNQSELIGMSYLEIEKLVGKPTMIRENLDGFGTTKITKDATYSFGKDCYEIFKEIGQTIPTYPMIYFYYDKSDILIKIEKPNVLISN